MLVEMTKTVRIPPEKFHIKLNNAITEELDYEFANKVVVDIGLIICVRNLISIDDSILIPGDGASHIEVKFNVIAFRPIINQVIQGKIRTCSPEGVHVTLEFFDDILVPPNSLPEPSTFDETEQAWYWQYDKGDGEVHKLYMDPGEKVKFRVQSEHFENIPPDTEQGVPYRIVGSMSEQGLGVIAWWK